MKTTFVNTSELFDSSNRADCTVRAFAVCMNCTYMEAEAYMAENLGRTNNKGVSAYSLLSHLRAIAKEIINKLTAKEKTPTYNQFKKSLMQENKTYYIIVKGHALAVKNGVIYGNESDSKISRKRLWGVYEF